MPDVPEVLDAQAGEDQQRDRQRPLDALGAAERVRLPQRPRRLLLREGQQLADVLGIVELLEPVAVAPAHGARLLRVEAAADQVDVLLHGGIDPDDSGAPRGGACLAIRNAIAVRGSPAGTSGGRKCRSPSLKLLALEEHREAGDLLDRQDAAPHQRRGEAPEEDDVAVDGRRLQRPDRRLGIRAGSACVMRSIQRATSARKLSGNRSSGRVSGSDMKGEARTADGQPGTVRPKWFHIAIVCLMTLRGMLGHALRLEGVVQADEVLGAHLLRRDAERGAVVRQPLDPLQIGLVLDALEKRAPTPAVSGTREVRRVRFMPKRSTARTISERMLA